MNRRPAAYSEVITYWRGVKGTLRQRGLLRQKRSDGTPVVPCANALVLPDRVVFVLDMNRLAGIPREKWLDKDLWLQLRATLRGRRCFVADSAGLAIVVAREPGDPHRKRLPVKVALDPSDVPAGRYTATLGPSRGGDVILDLSRGERAILIGGAPGKGKTTSMLSIVLQLVKKNGPDTLQMAIVDLKRLDFPPLDSLPHLSRPVATTEPEAVDMVAWARSEMERRFDVMSAAQVTRWDRMPSEDRFPLLLVVIDEAADFAKSAVMDNLVELARKSRAAGIALILATQRPDKQVLNRQVKATVETRIAFAVTDRFESDVILDRKGAEDLDRVGQCITNAGGEWRTAQAAYIPEQSLGEWIDDVGHSRPILSDVERALVRHAIKELDGAFTISGLYSAQEDGRLDAKERISRYALKRLARDWERRGWLTEPTRNEQGHKIGRLVTSELAELAGFTTDGHGTTDRTADGTQNEPIGRHVTHRTTGRNEPPQVGGGGVDLPEFLERRFSR